MGFQKGNKLGVANKGHKLSQTQKDLLRATHLGKKASQETKEKMSKAHKGRKILWADKLSENRAYQWKGDKAGYGAIHRWVRKWKGKADHCEMCGDTGDRRYEWANVDGKYRRVLEDYIPMCCSCHTKYDSNHKNKWKYPQKFRNH